MLVGLEINIFNAIETGPYGTVYTCHLEVYGYCISKFYKHHIECKNLQGSMTILNFTR